MRLHYKKLGPYIREVSIKNIDLEVEKLLGVSITKEFIPSIANIIGTDMSRYKIVRTNQFAYGPVTSRNSDKISVALLQEDDCIVSTSYTVFEIIDTNELLPEYLMMWFRRPEFDRYARYMSHGSVRELFGWDEMRDVELPVPSIEKQREIVKEYHTIVDRIKLNEQLNQKLEETAQAIYKLWFVDFEFPISAGYALSISKPELAGKPYKSSGGEMVYNEELEQEIPKGWWTSTLGGVLAARGYIRGPFGSALRKDDMESEGIPVYEQQHAIYNHRAFRYFIGEEKYQSLKRFCVQPNDMVISCSGTLGRVTMIQSDDLLGIINQALLIFRPDSRKVAPLILKYYLTSQKGHAAIVSNSGGSAQTNIAKREVIESIPFILPPLPEQEIINSQLLPCDTQIEILRRENELLERTKDILLAKIATLREERR